MCRQLGPVVSEVASEVANVDFYYVDVDYTPDLARQFMVVGIPTLVLVKGGVEVDRSVGAIPKSKVIAFARS